MSEIKGQGMILIQKCVKNGWPTDESAEMIDEALLEYSEGVLDDENERTVWREWRLDGKIVKRGAHVTLKKSVVAEGIAAMLG
jgi:hypothetical protein